MYVLCIDIVIVSVGLATIHYFGCCCPSAMTPKGHLDYSHRKMPLVVPWPTASMLLSVVFCWIGNELHLGEGY
jgi:hypothetical protein